MRQNLQLRVAAPCGENWEEMKPEEKGRFCGSCSKVVVDFSMMSDREVLEYLGRAGQHVCGRFAPEQLDRRFELGDVRKRRWMGWSFLLAGLLVVLKGAAQGRTKGEVQVVQVRPAPGGVRIMGDTVPVKKVEEEKILGGVVAGIPVIPAGEKVKVLPEVVVHGYTQQLRKGDYSIVERVSPFKDTLNALGLLRKKELTVYPNPVRRGMTVSLSWKTEPGRYEVGVYNAAGAVLQRKILEVESETQVDLMEIPAGMPGGVYFLRAVGVFGAGDKGREKVITQKIVVM